MEIEGGGGRWGRTWGKMGQDLVEVGMIDRSKIIINNNNNQLNLYFPM